MSEIFTLAVYFFLPLTIAGCLHMGAVKFDFLNFTAIPINKKLFGPNKTWRGFILYPLFTLFGVVFTFQFFDFSLIPIDKTFQSINYILAGLLLGFFYALFELPNSYIKRRLKIPSGERSQSHPYFFVLLDQLDSVVGCLLVYNIFFNISLLMNVVLFVFAPIVHLFVNYTLYLFRLRKQPV